ncbi:competence protein CoiA [Sutcliffiella halmapala]|uniref:competence protein CoiA n=1 Tax=Sutcliffiella halmapala TaxID=79882 RepID=UPI001115CDE1|nr:competence protein CoiA family protein [Sutcliffiella halmapala]
MFVAKRKDGSFITLMDLKNTQELELKGDKNQGFFCPACGAEVRVKNGEIRRIHFAHVQAECRAATEPETWYHLEGKDKLYKVLQDYGATQLESFIPQTKQRADILLETDRKFAFEFQCSSINPSTLKRRTKLYESILITPIWLIGKEKLGAVDTHMKLSTFQWAFLQNHSSDSSPYLLSFCPQQSLFYYLFPTFSFSSLDTYLTYQSSKEWQLEPKLITSKNKPMYWKTKWLHHKKQWRYNYCLYKQNQQLRYYCYNKMHIPLSLFPAEIGLPVPSSYWFQTPIIQWQAWLYFDSIYKTPVSSIIHVPSIVKRFNQRIKQSFIKVKDLPLVKYGHYEDAIKEYLMLLELLGILEKESSIIYRKKKKEMPYTHLEEASVQDKQVLERILQIQEGKDI